MTEVRPIDDLVAQYRVYGEVAPLGRVPALLGVGMLLAVAAAWLLEHQQGVAPALVPQHPTLVSASPVAVNRSNAEPLIGQASPPSGVAVSVAVAASAALAVKTQRPQCPQALAIYFPVGQAAPDAAGVQPELARLIGWAQQNPSAKLAVEGHADAQGHDEANLLLSYKRARAVASLLADGGVPPQQVQIAAAGSHAPVEGESADAHANRRVAVHIIDPNGCQTATPTNP
jgi:outer membrane protein OmpA-like peptidoglycan-associated protein